DTTPDIFICPEAWLSIKIKNRVIEIFIRLIFRDYTVKVQLAYKLSKKELPKCIVIWMNCRKRGTNFYLQPRKT
ncbi:MAG TPA: hypothetical protein VJ184_15515, partial [Chryseolinea sp.]|nr:hypothetical protein [Chryseolinea sp.]